MKKTLFIFCLWTAISIPGIVYAEDAVDNPNSLSVDEEICNFLVEHQPSSDVEYQPGIDVNGKPVIEAETSQSIFSAPPDDELSFDISVDLAKYMGITVPGDALEGQAKFGTVSFKGGILTLDGQPLSPENDASLRGLCDTKKQPEKTEQKEELPAKAP